MKKIRLIMICACLILASTGVGAKSMKDLLVSMPDSLLPYLDRNLRLELPELQEMGVKAEVKNLLEENSVMDTLTADFLQLRLSKVAILQMKKLPTGNDSLVCVVKTIAGPEKESQVMLFDQDWNSKDVQTLFDGKSLQQLAGTLVLKPDTMSEGRFAELQSMIEPQMVNALLMQHDNSIVVRLSLPLLSAEDKKAINVIKMQRKFNWNGKTFKES